MQTREWKTIDKSAWGAGPWQREPDKRQWQDEATGLPCLMVRNGRAGNWCGYVGVPKGHPWHGVDYGECSLPGSQPQGVKDGDDKYGAWATKRSRERRVCGDETWCDHRPESMTDVHGGITFSGKCADSSREAWTRWAEHQRARADEARQYPQGDAARDLRDHAAAIDDHSVYVEMVQASSICHVPDAGEPDDVWWFGFDCAHSGDRSPGYDRASMLNLGYGGMNVYRDAEYVAAQCRDLARQLHARASEPQGEAR